MFKAGRAMHVYLMRHGAAVERDEWEGKDDSRPLTKAGRREVKAVAKALKAARQVAVEAVWTSPLARARETAEVAAQALGAPVRECPELACGAELGSVAAALAAGRAPERVMLVGHEPDFGFLLVGLLGKSQPRPFKKAGVAYLTGEFRAGGMKLRWHLAPKDLLGK